MNRDSGIQETKCSAEVAAEESLLQTMSAGTSADACELGGKETILLVEDEGFILRAVREALESAGYNVLVAACAAQAKEAHRRYPDCVDLLLADVVMPGKSGNELAEDLVAAIPGLRVLLMSGYAQPQGAGEWCAYPKAYMAKPFSTATLLKKVRELLDRSAAGCGAF